MVKLFFDTEFTDLKQNCELISIGIVAVEGGKIQACFYGESIDYSGDMCSDFVKSDVIPQLLFDKPNSIRSSRVENGYKDYGVCGTEEDIKANLVEWVHQFLPEDYLPAEDGKIEVWGDCLSYDWVLFNHLFEEEGELPKSIYYIPFDLCTYMKLKGVDSDINREEFASTQYDLGDTTIKHNSLFDAMVIYHCYDILESM